MKEFFKVILLAAVIIGVFVTASEIIFPHRQNISNSIEMKYGAPDDNDALRNPQGERISHDEISLQACKDEKRWTSARFEMRGATQVLVLSCGERKETEGP